MINFCHYTVGCSTSSFHLDNPKMIMDCSKSGRWIITFKKFGVVRDKLHVLLFINSHHLDFFIFKHFKRLIFLILYCLRVSTKVGQEIEGESEKGLSVYK